MNIQSLSAISSGDAVLGTVVSNNFSQVALAVNSGALNSVNYGVSSIKSQNIRQDAVIAPHIAATQIGTVKIDDAAVIHGNLQVDQSDPDAVPVVQFGGSKMNGVGLVRMSQTLQLVTNTASYEPVFAWTDAIEGDPGFTADPNVLGFSFELANSDNSTPIRRNVISIDSVSAKCLFVFSDNSHTDVVTVHMMAEGAMS